jgi:hypothetical protein
MFSQLKYKETSVMNATEYEYCYSYLRKCNPCYLGSKGSQDHSPTAVPREQLQTLPEKLTKAKRAGGMVQVVQHLPCKCEALSSNPNIPKQKQKLQK